MLLYIIRDRALKGAKIISYKVSRELGGNNFHMNFKQLNESFKSFGITEDADEFNDLNNDYNLPLNDVEAFEDTYVTDTYAEEHVNELVDDLAHDAYIIPETPAVPYLSNGDPGYPGEPVGFEIPDFNYDEFCNYLFQDWLFDVLHDDKVTTDELISNTEKYKSVLKEIFDDYVKPTKDSLYNAAEERAAVLYSNGYFE